MREHEGVRNTAGSAPTRRTRCRSLLVPSPTQIAESGFVAVDFETANRMVVSRPANWPWSKCMTDTSSTG